MFIDIKMHYKQTNKQAKEHFNQCNELVAAAYLSADVCALIIKEQKSKKMR